MIKAEVHIPDDFAEQLIAEAMKQAMPVLQQVAEQTPALIKDQAILENEDVDGRQMPQKKPRPKRSPRNFPNLPLIWNEDPDEMNNSRWTVEGTGETEVTVTYQPSDHHGFLAEKGRDWLNTEKMNPSARAKIEAALKEGLE